jgi:hypothetical protein
VNGATTNEPARENNAKSDALSVKEFAKTGIDQGRETVVVAGMNAQPRSRGADQQERDSRILKQKTTRENYESIRMIEGT